MATFHQNFWRKELVGLAVLVGLASAVLLLLWQLGQITLVGQVTVVQIITGLLVLVGLYWTSRRVLAAEENARVAQEGQITERFTKAIEQLGHDEIAIRLGGIYALERIAKDSEKDHGSIMEVLTAYVREKAPRQTKTQRTLTEKPPTDMKRALKEQVRLLRSARSRASRAEMIRKSFASRTVQRLMDRQPEQSIGLPQWTERKTALYLRQRPNDRPRHTRPSHERRL